MVDSFRCRKGWKMKCLHISFGSEAVDFNRSCTGWKLVVADPHLSTCFKAMIQYIQFPLSTW